MAIFKTRPTTGETAGKAQSETTNAIKKYLQDPEWRNESPSATGALREARSKDLSKQ
jgi:hypothetical protein